MSGGEGVLLLLVQAFITILAIALVGGAIVTVMGIGKRLFGRPAATEAGNVKQASGFAVAALVAIIILGAIGIALYGD